MDWQRTGDPEFPFATQVKKKECIIRLNDFPEEHLYTLVVNGVEVADFDDWPDKWSRPAMKKTGRQTESSESSEPSRRPVRVVKS